MQGVITDGGFRDSAEIAKTRLSGVPSPERADQSDAASGDRDQRSDRLRCMRRCFQGRHYLGDSDGVIVIPRISPMKSPTRPLEMTAFEDFVTEERSARAAASSGSIRDRSADADRFRGLAEGERAVGTARRRIGTEETRC